MRAVWWIIKIAILVAVAIWLANRPGAVAVEWQGYVVETSVGVLIVAVAALMLVAAFLYHLWRGAARTPGRWRNYRQRSKRERGYKALTYGMVAVAAGDPQAARRQARKADALLNEPPLTMLLSAQAAQLNGDDNAARSYFEAMLKRPETEFLGLRGLLNQSLRQDDPTRALSLARRAKDLRPETPWVQRAVLELEIRQRQWTEAQASLSSARKSGVIDEETARRWTTAILMERSRVDEAGGDSPAAQHHAQRHAHRALKLSPDFVPAAVREARLLARSGKDRQAQKVIDSAWTRAPHPDLMAAWLDLAPADEAPLDRVKRVERLHRLQPDHPESLTALAEAELAAKLWGAARGHLLKVERKAPTRRIYHLLADLEQAEHGDTAAARAWLAKASDSPPDPTWVCGQCGTTAIAWTALCGACGAFDTLAWRSPTEGLHLPAAGGSGTPLLTAPVAPGARPLVDGEGSAA